MVSTSGGLLPCHPTAEDIGTGWESGLFTGTCSGDKVALLRRLRYVSDQFAVREDVLRDRGHSPAQGRDVVDPEGIGRGRGCADDLDALVGVVVNCCLRQQSLSPLLSRDGEKKDSYTTLHFHLSAHFALWSSREW